MSSNDIQKAFEFFKLNTNATKRDVKDAFNKYSRYYHSDTGGENADAQKIRASKEAKDLLYAYFDNKDTFNTQGKKENIVKKKIELPEKKYIENLKTTNESEKKNDEISNLPTNDIDDKDKIIKDDEISNLLTNDIDDKDKIIKDDEISNLLTNDIDDKDKIIKDNSNINSSSDQFEENPKKYPQIKYGGHINRINVKKDKTNHNNQLDNRKLRNLQDSCKNWSDLFFLFLILNVMLYPIFIRFYKKKQFPFKKFFMTCILAFMSFYFLFKRYYIQLQFYYDNILIGDSKNLAIIVKLKMIILFLWIIQLLLNTFRVDNEKKESGGVKLLTLFLILVANTYLDFFKKTHMFIHRALKSSFDAHFYHSIILKLILMVFYCSLCHKNTKMRAVLIILIQTLVMMNFNFRQSGLLLAVIYGLQLGSLNLWLTRKITFMPIFYLIPFSIAVYFFLRIGLLSKFYGLDMEFNNIKK